MLCPVCKNEYGVDFVCSNCGFDQFRSEFVSREDAEDWLQNVVIPYRDKYNSQACISSVDWIGKLYQSKEVQYFLDITVPAAIKQGSTIGHTLLICPHARLVYSFATILNGLVEPRAVLCSSQNEQQLQAPTTQADVVRSTLIEPYEDTSAMAARITNMPEGSIFIQASSLLPTKKEPRDVLTLVLRDSYFEIVIGKGPAARRIRLDTAPFTLLAFADKESEVPKDYLQSFENVLHVDLSALEICELEAISTATEMGYTITQSAAKKIASNSEQNPRKASVFARRICDYLLVKEPDNKNLTDVSVDTVLSQFM